MENLFIGVKEANEKLKEKFANLSTDQVNTVIARAINRTLTMGKAKLKRNIKKRYNIPEMDFKKIGIYTANKNALFGDILVSAKPISLSHFNPIFKYMEGNKTMKYSLMFKKSSVIKKSTKATGDAGGGVSFEVIKGQRKTLPFAFMIKNDIHKPVFARGSYPGHFGFMQRHKRVASTGNDNPISKLITVSLYSASKNEQVTKDNTMDMTKDYEARVEHELKYLISKM